MHFDDRIIFANRCPIRKRDRFTVITIKAHLKQAIWRVGDGSHMPDMHGETFPDRPETQEAACLTRSRLKSQPPTPPYAVPCRLRLHWQGRTLHFLLSRLRLNQCPRARAFSHVEYEERAQNKKERGGGKDEPIASGCLLKMIGDSDDNAPQ